MSGGGAGTSGGPGGTSGLIPWRLWSVGLAIVLFVNLINVSSVLIENPPGNRDFAAWEPWSWELSSAVGFAVLLPVIYWVYQRFHWRRLSLPRFLAGQVVGWVIYTLGHDAIMVGLRHVIYRLMGSAYDFAHGDLLLQLVYEGRKDVLTCALMAAIFWVHERLQSVEAVAELPARIEVKSDGRVMYVTPAEIVTVEAAGNYVELHLTGPAKALLLRGTLAEYEVRLGPYGFVRIHRSRLVNVARMKAFTVTASGDVRIELEDGREVAGSRRYRAGLERKA